MLGTTRFLTDRTGPDRNGTASGAATYTAFGERVSGTLERYGFAGAGGVQGVSSIPYLQAGSGFYDPATGWSLQEYLRKSSPHHAVLLGEWNWKGFIGGIIGGMIAGATGGAVAGSLIPGVGTVAGGIIGGIAGGIAGGIVGGMAGHGYVDGAVKGGIAGGIAGTAATCAWGAMGYYGGYLWLGWGPTGGWGTFYYSGDGGAWFMGFRGYLFRATSTLPSIITRVPVLNPSAIPTVRNMGDGGGWNCLITVLQVWWQSMLL